MGNRTQITLCVAVALCTTAIVSQITQADDYPRQPGVDVLNYRIEIALRDDFDIIEGTTTVTFQFTRESADTITFDFINVSHDPDDEITAGMSVDSVTLDGAPIDFTHNTNRLTINTHSEPGSEQTEQRTITINYHGTPADGLIISDNKFGTRTYFADNFPDRARHWFPCVDHPYDKATCEFIVTAPARCQVIANGLQIEETCISPTETRTHWREETPISTYLMVIGTAEFAVQTKTRLRDIPIQAWVFTPERDEGFEDFAPTAQIIEFFEARLGPFPFDKLANVQSKTRYGGMENATAIFYNESLISRERPFTGTVVHEIAHQWFGDCVTVDDWNHIWLSEGFATYLTHVWYEETEGVERMNERLKRDRDRILRYEARHPDIAVVDDSVPVDQILSALTYQKGSWFLHALRQRIGDEAFWAGLRLYLARHEHGNALTSDFRAAVEQVSGEDLQELFERWLYEPGQLHGEALYQLEPDTEREAGDR